MTYNKGDVDCADSVILEEIVPSSIWIKVKDLLLCVSQMLLVLGNACDVLCSVFPI